MINPYTNEKDLYATSDLYIATMLFTVGYQLKKIDTFSNERTALFVFVRDDELDGFIKEYNDYSLELSARKMLDNVKSLKSMLYNA